MSSLLKTNEDMKIQYDMIEVECRQIHSFGYWK